MEMSSACESTAGFFGRFLLFIYLFISSFSPDHIWNLYEKEGVGQGEKIGNSCNQIK